MKTKNLIKNVLSFAVQLILYYVLNDERLPLSVSLYFAVVLSDLGVLLPSAALVLSFLRYKSPLMIADALLTAAGTSLVYALYKKRKKTPSVETVLYILVSQSLYLAFYNGELLQKSVYTAIITVFYFVCHVCVNTVVYKNLTAEPTLGEGVSVGATLGVVALGLMTLVGGDLYKAIAVFLLLVSVKIYKSHSALFIAAFLALPLAVYYNRLDYFALCFAFFFVSYPFRDTIGLLPALLCVGVDVAFAYLLRFYDVYGYIEALFVAVPSLLFAVIPASVFDLIIERSYLCGDKISTQAVARVKSSLSGKIYDLAGAFAEMNGALKVLSGQDERKKAAISRISKTSAAKACEKCSDYKICKLSGSAFLEKLVELGMNKGRLTLVDLPKEFMDGCVNPNPLIFEINRLIDVYLEDMKKLAQTDDVKKILSASALGVEQRLSEIAFDLARFEARDKVAEQKLNRHLLRKGIKNYGVTVGDSGGEMISLIVKENVDEQFLLSAICDFKEKPVDKTDEQRLNDGLKYIEYKDAPALDVAFGVSAMKKFGSASSGDVHSIMKLDEHRLLVALSDGMGSGEGALSTSSASIGLIEGMLKAGIKQNVVLPIVNEIISVSTEDNFSAIDIGIIDLSEGAFDFIKIGAPYGFILSKEGIRFVEGSSLPIGIISRLNPTTAHAGAKSGDVVIMTSDGVTDAFGSSTDFIEFLKSAPTRNPQTLADSVIKQALHLTGGGAEDDMTCLCVRLFDRRA